MRLVSQSQTRGCTIQRFGPQNALSDRESLRKPHRFLNQIFKGQSESWGWEYTRFLVPLAGSIIIIISTLVVVSCMVPNVIFLNVMLLFTSCEQKLTRCGLARVQNSQTTPHVEATSQYETSSID